MPIKDKERREKINKAWRQSRTKEYFRWLYDRRAFRFWKAEKFEEVLEMIASGEYKEMTGEPITPEGLATIWLEEARQTDLRIGRYYDHVKNEPTNDPTGKKKGKGNSNAES